MYFKELNQIYFKKHFRP